MENIIAYWEESKQSELLASKLDLLQTLLGGLLITTKNYVNLIFCFIFLTIFANFYIFLKIMPLVFIAKFWVMAFLLLKLCKFRYLSFLKSSFLRVKKLFFSLLLSVKEGLDTTVLSSFLEKRMLVFIFISYLFQHSTPWMYSRWG